MKQNIFGSCDATFNTKIYSVGYFVAKTIGGQAAVAPFGAGAGRSH